MVAALVVGDGSVVVEVVALGEGADSGGGRTVVAVVAVPESPPHAETPSASTAAAVAIMRAPKISVTGLSEQVRDGAVDLSGEIRAVCCVHSSKH